MDAGSAEGVVERVVDQFFEAAGLAPPIAAARLRDAGLSSLQLVELIFALEDALGLAIPESLMTPENFESKTSIVAVLTGVLVEHS